MDEAVTTIAWQSLNRRFNEGARVRFVIDHQDLDSRKVGVRNLVEPTRICGLPGMLTRRIRFQ
jgi:hypothetical protein